jgi:predicted GNAT family acetyltransferase
MSENHGNVKVFANTAAQRFEAEVAGYQAVLEYYLAESSIVFTHTGVPAEIEGQGVGSSLARAGLDYARDKKLTVVPLCPFVEDYLRKHQEDLPLVEPRYRKRLFPESPIS